jgi:hypothetical protein
MLVIPRDLLIFIRTTGKTDRFIRPDFLSVISGDNVDGHPLFTLSLNL